MKLSDTISDRAVLLVTAVAVAFAFAFAKSVESFVGSVVLVYGVFFVLANVVGLVAEIVKAIRR